MPRYKLKISGRVQGVAYRYSTRQQALSLGLKGIVKNEPDGSVYAEIEGKEKALQIMIDWCRKGPDLAVVAEVEVVPAPEANYSFFEIIR